MTGFSLCRKQAVEVGILHFTSRRKILNTGIPLTVCSLFINDIIAHMPNSTLSKFPDDIDVIGLKIDDDESDHRNEIEWLVKWMNDNNLILKVDKKLIVDFRKCRNSKVVLSNK